MKVRIIATLSIVAAITLIALSACAPLTYKAPVSSPVVKYVPPTPLPDGTVSPGYYATNWVNHPGTLPNDQLITGINQTLNTMGPWGSLAASALALGVAGWSRYQNTRALTKHIEDSHTDDGK
jgi:hypothetical protein